MYTDGPLMRLFCTGRGTHMEVMGVPFGYGVKEITYHHKAGESPKLEMTLDLGMLCEQTPRGFDEAYSEYIENLKELREEDGGSWENPAKTIHIEPMVTKRRRTE